jgi:hypothetical protein
VNLSNLASLANILTITRAEKKAARAIARLHPNDHPPVIVVGGALAPSERGTSAHYETTGGAWIHYPNAYGRKGRSNMHYVSSTRRVEVGAEWLAQFRAGALPYAPHR